ncbi:DUF1993 domain-containing protein [Erythrobacter sp. SCSIO 43205]|uniref:DUF1993 domain-containing protein n=1 Tax=Erythrobacter sp. SCSIO 43205 TaxID=2779361 RepID=UPI001CA88CF4|nr:DUF1993 domain-containing protein [Erythrobacter sp. SCSIO 43205]UAB77878.1 DUF1993 domain-containing protein [Erythrobacter sp. SCSIO 43205]
MPLSLHQAFVPSALQMLGTAQHLLTKTESWCAEKDCDHDAILNARLIEDMLPFTYQIKSVAEHTAGAIEALGEGVYSPDLTPPPTTFDGLREKLSHAKSVMEGLDEAEMESWIGRDMRFEFKTTRLDFTVEDFLLSFSQPNFYFHCSAAYSIARHLGVPIGKTDFLGRMRIRSA